MPQSTIRDLAVLKFGSSVLRTEADLPSAVHEIYRHLRQGRRVLAVVSAFAGTTDRLLGNIRRYTDRPQPSAVSALLATGEQTSAALLALHLERSGIPAELLDVRQIDLRTRGPVLDAEPVDIDVSAIAQSLAHSPVAILPGFIGIGGGGRMTLLGRGGSDLSALFVASRTGAVQCRLIKDVDGLYERDPASEVGPAPRRFTAISWDDALQLDPRIIQPKGVRFAREHQLSFEVAAAGSETPTCIGEGPTALEDASPGNGQPLRVVLLGLGTVGLGVYRLLARDPRFEVVRIAVTDEAKHRDEGVPADLLVTDAWKAIGPEHDVLVELIGGREPATSLIEASLEAGRSVVTANKMIIANHGHRLGQLAAARGAELLYSAAVAGALPAIETARVLAREAPLAAIQGVLNGTTNFILDRLAAGVAMQDAVSEAQALGFAEADPTLDLNGFDAACKLAILAREAFGIGLDPASIRREGIEELTAESVREQAPDGKTLRLVASARRTEEGLVTRVSPVALPDSHPLAQIHGEENRILIETADGARHELTGKGAGRWPTAESVFADIAELATRKYSAPSLSTRSVPSAL